MTDTPPAAPPEVTPQQATALGAAATEGALADPANPQAGAEAAVTQAADRMNVKLSDEDKRDIAKLTIEMLREAGAFEQPPAPPPTAPATAAPQAGDAPAAASPAPGAPPPAAPAEQPPQPKRSFADWLRGS